MKGLALIHLPLAALIALTSPAQGQHEHAPAGGAALGRVVFPTSCVPEVQDEFELAVAMLHSFWYQAAEGAFTEIARDDPHCVMAFWGIAMSRFRQLWERPGPEDLRVGQAAIEAARTSGAGSERERSYIDALGHFYEDADQVDHLSRMLAYESAMEALHRRYPDDPEAEIFYALSLLGTANSSPPDETYARQKKARANLERVFVSQPEHPGVTHYIIHSTDYPPLAAEGLDAARRYAGIAPDAPHALHMPSHIFTRLGLWQESIASNGAAAEAARREGWTGEELHASDYLTYAYLQGGQDERAREIVEKLPEMGSRMDERDPNYPAGLYALAAIPARYAAERGQWAEAAALELPEGLFPGGQMCWAETTLFFARGLGAAKTGALADARRALEQLDACREALLQVNESVWSNLVTAQWQAVSAQLALAEGKSEEALALMRSAADLEDGTDKPPASVGSVVPARELLGQLLVEHQQPAAALAEFETGLISAPNRFHSVHGAAVAARAAGDDAKSREYYAKLGELTRLADSERPELREATAAAVEE